MIGDIAGQIMVLKTANLQSQLHQPTKKDEEKGMGNFVGPFTVGFQDVEKPVERFTALQRVKINHRLQANLRLRKEDFTKFIVSWKGPDEEIDPELRTDTDVEFYLTPNERMCYWMNGDDGQAFVHEAFWLFDTIENAKEEALRRRPLWGRICTVYSMNILKKDKWINLSRVWSGRVKIQ